MATERLLTVGRISGVYGVRGWVRVYSHTDPREGILQYRGWHLHIGGQWKPFDMVEGRVHGKGIVVRFAQIDDRDRARELIGADVAVPRSELPPTAPGEYYWADLEGLRVRTEQGAELGHVDYLFETGANDVIVVRGPDRERLIPFVLEQVVKSVDLDGGTMIVDWDPDF